MNESPTATRGTALLAAVVVSLVLAALSLTALGLAKRDLSAGLSWSLAARARVALGSAVAAFLADTTRYDSLPRGVAVPLRPLTPAETRVEGTLTHIGDSVYTLEATARITHGATSLTSVRSVLLLLSPCATPSPAIAARGALCPRDDGGAIHLLP